MSNEDQKLTPEIEELLAEISVFGSDSLTPEEQIQVASFSTEISDFEVIAAATLQQDISEEPIPNAVQKRLAALIEGERDSIAPTGIQSKQKPPSNTKARLRGPGLPIWVTWFAAAACLLIGVAIGRIDSRPPTATIAERMEQLLGRPGTIVAKWEGQADPAGDGVTGRVVWNEKLDEGYMTFIGLSPNDPQIEQYQLWVFDDARDPEIPVDGGVFDVVGSPKEVVVPIRQNLSITKASLFAITVEKPGGVMKSDRTRLPLLAKVE